MGITKTLPKNVQDAWKLLEEDKQMVHELGEEFVKRYLSVKQVKATKAFG
jgi:glutamine synthetase